jgi:uncharacterized damage-inducible protein DinB
MNQDYTRHWNESRERTFRLMEKIDEAKLDFRPLPNYGSIREQVAHIFAAELSVVRGIDDGKFLWKETMDEMLTLSLDDLKNSGRETDRALANLVENAESAWLAARVPGSSSTLTREQWLQELFEHEIHHRGQLSLTMRLAGLDVISMYG